MKCYAMQTFLCDIGAVIDNSGVLTFLLIGRPTHGMGDNIDLLTDRPPNTRYG